MFNLLLLFSEIQNNNGWNHHLLKMSQGRGMAE